MSPTTPQPMFRRERHRFEDDDVQTVHDVRDIARGLGDRQSQEAEGLPTAQQWFDARPEEWRSSEKGAVAQSNLDGRAAFAALYGEAADAALKLATKLEEVAAADAKLAADADAADDAWQSAEAPLKGDPKKAAAT